MLKTLASTPLSPSGDLPRTLFGYDVVEFLGEGAGSLIYAVSDPSTKQVYALKHVVVKNDRDVRFADQLRNEYDVALALAHPRLRRVIDLKLTRSLLRKITEAGLVMELVDGIPMEVRPPAKMAAMIETMLETAAALHAMHARGYVHCDLKPNNILLEPGGTIKVIDLGQACTVGTVKKRIQGTPDFIAPEQVRCEPCTVRTDVYNFGATFYWALCGRKVPTLFTLKKSENSFLVSDQIPAPHEVNPRVPFQLSNLVMECVRAHANKRPPDMHELTRRLEIVRYAILRETPTAAPVLA